MTVSPEDIPAVSPGGLTLTPAERLTLLDHGVLTLAQRDGSTLVLWLNGAGRLSEQYYPAAPAAGVRSIRKPRAATGTMMNRNRMTASRPELCGRTVIYVLQRYFICPASVYAFRYAPDPGNTTFAFLMWPIRNTEVIQR